MRLASRILFVNLLLFIHSTSNAQSIRSFFKVSGQERCWAISHIFIAKKTFRLSQSVLSVCDSLKKQNVFSGNGNGDQLDAFRHAYWMALLVQHIKPKKAIKLGIAHEKGNYISFKKGKTEEGEQPDSLSSVMDLANNETGKNIGVLLKSEVKFNGANFLIQKVIDNIKAGNAKILLKNREGQFLNCNKEIINMGEFNKKWNIPKCIVESDMVYW